MSKNRYLSPRRFRPNHRSSWDLKASLCSPWVLKYSSSWRWLYRPTQLTLYRVWIYCQPWSCPQWNRVRLIYSSGAFLKPSLVASQFGLSVLGTVTTQKMIQGVQSRGWVLDDAGGTSCLTLGKSVFSPAKWKVQLLPTSQVRAKWGHLFECIYHDAGPIVNTQKVMAYRK